MKREIYDASEKMNLYLNVKPEDTKLFEDIYIGALKNMEYTLKERTVSLYPKRGEIWTIDLGFNSGAEMNKIRPFVVFSNNDFNKRSNLVSGFPISHCMEEFESQFELSEELFEFKKDDIEGTVVCEQITTKSQARLGRFIGKLNEKGIQKMIECHFHHFDINLDSNYELKSKVLK